MAGDQDWKGKYFDALGELEQLEKDWKAREEVLVFAVNRLSLLGQGLDTRLDPHLESLRLGLRRNQTTERLRAELSCIAELLDELRHLGKSGLDDELVHLLSMMRLPPARQPALDTLLVRLRQTQPPRGQLLEAIAMELNQVLLPATRELPVPQLAAPQAAVTPPPGESAVHGGRTLSTLLERLRLPWTPELEALRETLRVHLEQAMSAEDWQAALATCAELVNRALGTIGGERDELRGFLEQVTERLAALEHYVDGNRGTLADARGSGDQLQGAMAAEMRGMRDSIGNAHDLASLKRSVLGHVERIDAALQAFKSAEEARLDAFGARIEGLATQLGDLSREAGTLRRELAERDQRLRSDPLTELGNRRAWDEALEREFGRWVAHGKPLTLALWDIDWFKRVNDQLGHAIGDQVLVGVARALAAGVRAGDCLARYGGEEFALLLPGLGVEEALAIAERLRAAVATHSIVVSGGEVGVTVSCGLSEFRQGDDPAAVFKRADDALYAAKHGGRNRCFAQ